MQAEPRLYMRAGLRRGLLQEKKPQWLRSGREERVAKTSGLCQALLSTREAKSDELLLVPPRIAILVPDETNDSAGPNLLQCCPCSGCAPAYSALRVSEWPPNLQLSATTAQALERLK